jgi:hypothetical protein
MEIVKRLITRFGQYNNEQPNPFSCLLVDEAHRLNEKSGLFSNLGKNQILGTRQSEWCSVELVDQKQTLTLKDIGSKGSLREWAQNQNAEVHEMAMESQFRCDDSNGYLAWLKYMLDIQKTANTELKKNLKQATAELHLIIKNTYRTPMTRGMKSCYIFSEDEETRNWFGRNTNKLG